MRKKIYYATVYYKWRTVRYVKGVEKPSKAWREEKYKTCVTEIDPEELEKLPHIIRRLRLKHKSANEIEIKIVKVEDVDYICMSRDVY